MKVIERKIVNICIPNGSASANVGLNIPFKPDEMIVREFAYNTTEVATTRCLQLATNMVQDQILFVFPAYTNSSHLEHAFILDNFSQNRIWNFSIQVSPDAGTGAGPETTAGGGVLGSLFFMLEFVRYESHQKK
jgi:hypothetical protein